MPSDQHTPGPWSIWTDCNGVAITFEGPKGQGWLANTYRDDEYHGVLPYEANARLIAAAPEMLSILRDVIATASRLVADETPECSSGVVIDPDCYHAAIEIVAKVVGQ